MTTTWKLAHLLNTTEPEANLKYLPVTFQTVNYYFRYMQIYYAQRLLMICVCLFWFVVFLLKGFGCSVYCYYQRLGGPAPPRGEGTLTGPG